MDLNKLRKEHKRIKDGIADGSIKKTKWDSSEITHIFRIDDKSYFYNTTELKDLILRDKDKEFHVR